MVEAPFVASNSAQQACWTECILRRFHPSFGKNGAADKLVRPTQMLETIEPMAAFVCLLHAD